jgi:glycosyltransferase involved in cell wall biosynthesis
VKVLFLTTSFPRHEGDYAGIFVFHLAEHLSRGGIRISVVTPGDGHHKNEDVRNGIAIHRFHGFFNKKKAFLFEGGGLPAHLRKNKLLFLWMPFFLAAFLKAALREAKQADLVHCQWLPLGLLGLVVKRVRKKAFIVTVRGSDKLFFRRPLRFLFRAILKEAGAVVFVGRELMAGLPSSGKYFVIPNGVDVSAQQHYSLEVSGKIVLYVGNLSRNKSVETLVRGAALLKDEEDFTVVMIGDGPERESLLSLVEKTGLAGRVLFLKSLPQEQIFYLMEKSTLVVMPSLSEGRSNVLLEALACGLPVIASRIPANAEIIADGVNGLLFHPGDPADLAQKIHILLRDQMLRNKLSEEGRRFIQTNELTWEHTSREYIQVYRKILSSEVS